MRVWDMFSYPPTNFPVNFRYSTDERMSTTSTRSWTTNGYDVVSSMPIRTQKWLNTNTFVRKVRTSSKVSWRPLIKKSFLVSALFSEGWSRRHSTAELRLKLMRRVYLSQSELLGERRVRMVKNSNGIVVAIDTPTMNMSMRQIRY